MSSRIHTVRTNIVIDDQLMKDTSGMTGLKTKRHLGLLSVITY